MKHRIFLVMGTLITGIFILAVFIFATSQAASAGNFFKFDTGQSPQVSQDGATVIARRLISIPFGIQDSLALSGDGRVVTVQGHGDCPSNGQDFILKVTVRQDSLHGLAVGHTTGACENGQRVMWQVDVAAPGSKTFTEGFAQACGHVVVHTRGGGDVVGDWCKAVTLQ